MRGLAGGGGFRNTIFKSDGTVQVQIDMTQWFYPKGADGTTCNPLAGAPSCDQDHWGTPDHPVMGPCCCWRDWDESRPVCSAAAPVSPQCGFRVNVMNGATFKGPVGTHGALLVGVQGASVALQICPPTDGVLTSDGIHVPLRGDSVFPNGCGSVKRWNLPKR